jgi:hypothetical protein
MTLLAAIHVPEKYGSRLAFIDDFGRRSKKAANLSPGGWVSDCIVSGSCSGLPPLFREVEERTGERRRVIF